MRRALAVILFTLTFPAAADAASVKVVECVPALDPAARTATFEARVRATRATARMQVRFTLQVREDGASGWRRVVAAGLDQWLTSDQGVRRYRYDKTVQNLTAPASYRTVVRFRLLDAEGGVLDHSRATSASCRQPDLRPDLAPLRIDVAPAAEDGTRRYTIAVRNDGRTAAGPFAVALRAGADQPTALTVPGLPAGEQRLVTLVGPACAAAAPLVASADPDGVIDERDEDDNVLAATCPP